MSESGGPAGVGGELKALVGPGLPYIVELLLADRVAIDADRLRRALADTSGEIDARRLAGGAISLSYRDRRRLRAGERTMVHLVSYSDAAGDVDGREAALLQTWDWGDPSVLAGTAHAGARAALARSRAVLSVVDTPGFAYAERLTLFQRLVRALIVQLPVLAIHWAPSARIVDPAKYVAPDPVDPICQGPVNVRLFKPLDAAPGTMLMDTLGLNAFGLRDLEVLFHEPAPDVVAGFLYEAARQIFERGAFIEDGDTIDGIGTRWRCHHGVAAVAPARDVIEFRPREEPPAVGRPSAGVRCPECGWVPDTLARWECDCGFIWNTFDTRASCPACQKRHAETVCLRCESAIAHDRWYV